MRRKIRMLSALLLAAVAMVLVVGQLPAGATGTVQGTIPSAVPGSAPHIADNPDPNGAAYKVLDMAQVGNRIVVVGQFAQVQNPSSTGAPTGALINRANIFAFDPGTGQVDTAFAPAVSLDPQNQLADLLCPENLVASMLEGDDDPARHILDVRIRCAPMIVSMPDPRGIAIAAWARADPSGETTRRAPARMVATSRASRFSGKTMLKPWLRSTSLTCSRLARPRPLPVSPRARKTRLSALAGAPTSRRS